MLVSLATAMVCGMAMGPLSGKETGESALMRQLVDQLDPNDILLADKYFCSYFMIAMLTLMNVDIVSRLPSSRKEDTYRIQRLGKGDYLVEWPRPDKPDWMDQATYDQMPESLTLRQLDVQVDQPGFRVESFVVVTTLAASKEYSTLLNCITGDGLSNWTFARSSAPWEWTCYGARHRLWFVKNAGRACWRTT